MKVQSFFLFGAVLLSGCASSSKWAAPDPGQRSPAAVIGVSPCIVDQQYFTNTSRQHLRPDIISYHGKLVAKDMKLHEPVDISTVTCSTQDKAGRQVLVSDRPKTYYLREISPDGTTCFKEVSVDDSGRERRSESCTQVVEECKVFDPSTRNGTEAGYGIKIVGAKKDQRCQVTNCAQNFMIMDGACWPAPH